MYCIFYSPHLCGSPTLTLQQIVLVPDTTQPDFWTSVYLCPNTFDDYKQDPRKIKYQTAELVLESLIEFTIFMVIDKWSAIEKYFAWLIGHRDTLSDPDMHDGLLFDDDTFSRSRKYFWAINYLAEIDISIAENITQLELWVSRSRKFGPDTTKYLADAVESRQAVRPISESLGLLLDMRARLKAQREEAIALRDGLFSASGVMESRASTRLGENVKLLTFVSIFFLPLSFCMSLWSINDQIFSLRSLAIVATIVGLGTYVVVFNLNNMVNFVGRIYGRHKKQLISLMIDDKDSGWKELGRRFATFQPKQEKIKPTEWMIVLFILHRLRRAINRPWHLKRKAKPATVEVEHHAGVHIAPDVSFQYGFDGSTNNTDAVKPPDSADLTEEVVKGGFVNRVIRRGALSPDSTGV